MELINLTGLAARPFLALDGEGREVLFVVAKGSFRIMLPSTLEPSEPVPISPVDVYLGEPGSSSLVSAGEATPFKPATDIALTGCAYAGRRGSDTTLAGFRMGALTKLIRVFGDRRWERRASGFRASAPDSFEKIPLIYERAFGGTDDSDGGAPESCGENPVGVGFRAKGSRASPAGRPLPNFEDPRNLITAPEQRARPHALGPIPPFWSPRVSQAGTYDDAWQRSRMPLPPDDFDPRHHQTVPPDQILDGYLRGGEVIEVIGMAAEGNAHLEVPRLRPEVIVRILGERVALPVACDTLAIDMERRTLCLVWRASLVVQGRVDGIHWIKVQPGR